MALYNTFQFNSKDFQDADSLLEKLSALKNSGTDLALPVITPKGILSFTDYIIGNTSLEFYGKAVKAKLIQNSYAFKIIDGAVIEHEVYTLKWMRSNFAKHKDLILDAIECLAKDLNTNPANKFTGTAYSKKTYTIDNMPPLMHVINNVDSNRYSYYEKAKAEIWDIALTHNQELKEYLKPLLSSHNKIRNILKWPRPDAEFGFHGMATLLYHHGFLDTYVENNPNEAASILHDSIIKNELKDVKKLIPIYQKSFLLSPDNNHEMLRDVLTPEMANLLMENGFSMYNYKPHHDNPQQKVLLLSLRKEMNMETIDAILSFKPSHREIMKKNPVPIFEEFFDLQNFGKNPKLQTFEKMKLLVEQGFPLEQFDMLHVGFLLNKKDISYSKWFIEHGANPAHCEKFVRDLKHEKNFLNLIEKYSQIIDIKSPDFVCEIVRNIYYQNDTVKEYCKTISHDELLQPTSQGGYAWWGLDTNSTTFMQFMHNSDETTKINIKNSFATSTDSWIGQLFINDNFDRALGFLEQYKKLFFSPDEKYPFQLKDNQQENILHKIFNDDTRSPIVKFFLSETNININALLQQKNSQGQTPLEKLFFENEWDKERELYIRQSKTLAQIAKKIVNHLKEDFPFEAMVNNTQTAIDAIKERFPDEDEFEPFYRTALKNKIELQLPLKNTAQTKKIKI